MRAASDGDGETVTVGTTTPNGQLMPGAPRDCTRWTMPAVEDGVTHQVMFYRSTRVALHRLVVRP
jgi:hypothetical protein